MQSQVKRETVCPFRVISTVSPNWGWISCQHAYICSFLAYAQVDLSKAWLTFSSIVLAFAFVFGNSIRNMYEAVIFLFVVHPFDVGDVLLMGAEQTWCKVSASQMSGFRPAQQSCLLCCVVMKMYIAFYKHSPLIFTLPCSDNSASVCRGLCCRYYGGQTLVLWPRQT